jgi:hypothetical protein
MSGHGYATTAIAAAVIAAAVIVLGVSGCSSSTGPAGSPASASPATSTAPHSGHHHHTPRVTGKITAVSPTSWTIQTTSAQTFTVLFNNQTRFGTTKRPATKDQVGDLVQVTGTSSGSQLNAVSVRSAAIKSPSSGSVG